MAIERLNSLLEEVSVLNLYEYSDGEELSLKNNKIHPNFRIFATANMQRSFSNKVCTQLLSILFLLCVVIYCLSQSRNPNLASCPRLRCPHSHPPKICTHATSYKFAWRSFSRTRTGFTLPSFPCQS